MDNTCSCCDYHGLEKGDSQLNNTYIDYIQHINNMTIQDWEKITQEAEKHTIDDQEIEQEE